MFAFLYLPFVVFAAFVAAAPVAHDAAPSQALSKATESGSGQKSDKPGGALVNDLWGNMGGGYNDKGIGSWLKDILR